MIEDLKLYPNVSTLTAMIYTGKNNVNWNEVRACFAHAAATVAMVGNSVR